MSKKNDVVKDATPAPAPEASAPAANPAPAALAVTAPAAVVEAPPADPALANLPKKHQDSMARIIRPTVQEFEAAAKKCTATQQEALFGLLERMSPNKPGVHGGAEGFAPTMVKLYHGVGNDAARPAKLVPGSFYTATSRDLTDKMVVAVLGVTYGRTLWPPKDAESNQPVCSSNDSVHGTKYGACATCPSARLLTNQGGCTQQVNFWFIDQELTGIYELSFSKTSYKAGTVLAKTLSASRRVWDRWVEFSSVPSTKGDKQWFVIKATPVSDPKNPSNNDTSEALREAFSMFNRSLDLETYYPRLLRQYNFAANNGVGTPEAAPVGAGSALKPDTSDGDFGGANTGL